MPSVNIGKRGIAQLCTGGDARACVFLQPQTFDHRRNTVATLYLEPVWLRQRKQRGKNAHGSSLIKDTVGMAPGDNAPRQLEAIGLRDRRLARQGSTWWLASCNRTKSQGLDLGREANSARHKDRVCCLPYFGSRRTIFHARNAVLAQSIGPRLNEKGITITVSGIGASLVPHVYPLFRSTPDEAFRSDRKSKSMRVPDTEDQRAGSALSESIDLKFIPSESFSLLLFATHFSAALE